MNATTTLQLQHGTGFTQTQKSFVAPSTFGVEHVDPTGKFILEGVDHYKDLFSYSK